MLSDYAAQTITDANKQDPLHPAMYYSLERLAVAISRHVTPHGENKGAEASNSYGTDCPILYKLADCDIAAW